MTTALMQRDKGWSERALLGMTISGDIGDEAALRAQLVADIALSLGATRDAVRIGGLREVPEGVDVEVILRSDQVGRDGGSYRKLAAHLCEQASAS